MLQRILASSWVTFERGGKWQTLWCRCVTDRADTFSEQHTVTVTAAGEAAICNGVPWIYSKDLVRKDQLQAGSPCLVNVKSLGGKWLATATYNRVSSICGRILSTKETEVIDRQFFVTKLRNALRLREAVYSDPFYRVVHAEADELPGVVVDRYGGDVAVQIKASAMNTLIVPLIEAVEEVLEAKTIVLRNDAANREEESLPNYREVCRGKYKFPTEMRENGVTFFVDLFNGQKTGWFYDQRDNRAALLAYCKGKTVLDLYSYIGGFGIQAAVYGASSVVCIDSSSSALELGKLSAAANMVDDVVTFIKSDVTRFLDSMLPHTATSTPKVGSDNEQSDSFTKIEEKASGNDKSTVALERYEVVILDPPALAKGKANVNAALKIYTRIISKVALLISEGGLLFVSCCSHAIPYERLVQAIQAGLRQAGRCGKIIQETGASMDHPIHLALPETRYLRGALLSIK